VIRKPAILLALLLTASVVMLGVGVSVGSTGFAFSWRHEDDQMAQQILWRIRLPRSLGAWFAGALLALAGAISQGLFRNPLADPYLLGSASGAALGVALTLSFVGIAPASAIWLHRLGLTGAAFAGTLVGVLMTLILARGVEQTLRLLLAGVVVGVVLMSLANLIMLMEPEVMRAMTAFMLGTTGLLGWNSVALMSVALLLTLLVALGGSRALDALSLGDATSQSLGVRLGLTRVVLVGAFALATGTAVAQVGMIAFVGLVAPHLVRNYCPTTHGWLLLLSSCTGGALLLAADIVARWSVAPQELPVGIITALLGGGYLLYLMHRRGGRRA
jgi:iron complex transport system permease protein